MAAISFRSSASSTVVDGLQNAGDSADNILAVVAEVGQALSHLPYIQPLCGLILQFIRIRNEIKSNRNRCNEIIDKVLRKSKIIYDRLLEISRHTDDVRDKLHKLEGNLLGYQKVLKDVYKALETNKNRGSGPSGGLFRVLTERGLDELNRCDRLVDSVHLDIMLDMMMDIKITQAYSPSLAAEPMEGRQRQPSQSSYPISVRSAVVRAPSKPRLLVERGPVIERLTDMLNAKGSCRISLLGAEGMGKTTCCLAVMHDARIAERFAVIYYLSCESINNVQSILVGLAQILGISPAQSPVNLLPAISHFLNNTDTLLCLDNFETPWEPPDTRNDVEDVLASLSVIPTLSLVVAIRGTERPSKVAWSEPFLPPLDKLSLSGAETIVQDVAGIRVVDQNIRSLLVAVEGMPLAITLVSSLLRDGVETSSSLWRRWSYMERRQESVWGEDVSFTQVSKIDAAIAISINSPQMNKHPDAGVILATLALLPDGFSSSPAELESLLNFLEPDAIHKCLHTLQNLALIWIDETPNLHRIRMLLAVRTYCLKFLNSELDVVRPKLTEYYIDMVHAIGPPTAESSQRPEMEREIRNMHSVFRSKYSAGHLAEAELQKLIKATYFLTLWSTQLGYLLEDIPQRAIDAASNLPIPRARCLLAKCGMYRQAGRFDDAEQCCRQALTIFQEVNDLPGQGDAISTISGIYADKGEPNRGEETSTASRELVALSRKRRQLERDEEEGKAKLLSYGGNPAIPRWQVALAHLQLGVPTIYMPRPRLDSTLESLSRALDLYEKDRHAMGQATALFHIAFVYLLKNELSYARAIVERALGLSRAVVTQVANYTLPSTVGMMFNDLTSESEMQAVFNTLLGHIRIREDRLSEAKAILKKAVKKKAAYSVTPELRLGWCYLRQNKLDKAEKLFNDLQKRCKTLRFWEEEHEALGYQGLIQLRKGNLDGAEAILKESRKRGLLLYSEIDVLQVLGDVYIEKNQLQNAEEILTHALQLQRHIDSASGQGNILRSMGDVHARRGRFTEAMAVYEEARGFHRTAHWISEEVEDVQRIAFLQRGLGNRRAAEEAVAEVRRLKALLL